MRGPDSPVATHYIAVREDITERKAIEEQLLQSRKLVSIGQLAAGIAHEINTPVQFVSDSVDFLRESLESLLELLSMYQDSLKSPAITPEVEVARATARAAEDRMDLEYLREHGPSAVTLCRDGLGRIGGIVRAMKEFAHPDQREKAPADINDALANSLTIARNEYKYVADVETAYGPIPQVVCHLGDINQARRKTAWRFG